jgi:hypothetical protein
MSFLKTKLGIATCGCPWYECELTAIRGKVLNKHLESKKISVEIHQSFQGNSKMKTGQLFLPPVSFQSCAI